MSSNELTVIVDALLFQESDGVPSPVNSPDADTGTHDVHAQDTARVTAAEMEPYLAVARTAGPPRSVTPANHPIVTEALTIASRMTADDIERGERSVRKKAR